MYDNDVACQSAPANRRGRSPFHYSGFTTPTLRATVAFPSVADLGSLAVMCMDSPETNPELGKTILQVVENQIRDNDPPETRQTVERLRAEGYTLDEARRLVSTAVTVEIFHIIRDHEAYNRKRFLWNLAHLPREPWDQQGKEFYEC